MLEPESQNIVYASVIWIVLLVMAILNAIIRKTWYHPKVGELRGHQIITFTAIAYTLIITYLFVNHIKLDVTKTDLLWIGAFWVSLTIVFKFGFGHYIMGPPWSKLLADYDILKGRVWSLYLVTVFIAPLIWEYVK